MNDEYIKGAFLGALILCVLMLAFPKDQECFVKMNYKTGVHVSVGTWR
jgi:hypothetical protein